MTRLQWRQSADELSAAAEPIKVRLLQQTWFPVRLFIRHRLVSNQVWFWPEFCEKASAPNVKSPYFVIIMTIIMYVCVCRRLRAHGVSWNANKTLPLRSPAVAYDTHTHEQNEAKLYFGLRKKRILSLSFVLIVRRRRHSAGGRRSNCRRP